MCKASFPGRPPRCPVDGSALIDDGADLLGGRVIAGRYRLIERSGTGPTAEIYRALDIPTGAIVAARVPLHSTSRQPAARLRFNDQVRAFRKAFPHDLLVPVLDVAEATINGQSVVITEFLSTPALPQVLSQGPVSLSHALSTAEQLTSLLEHLHTRDVLARDLRAGAVFFSAPSPDQPVKIRVSIDALALGPTCPPDPIPAANSPEGLNVGYLSPERIRGEGGAAPSDLYALGALLFELLTARMAFTGTPSEVIRQHLEAPPPVLRQVIPTMPSRLEHLIARLMAKVARFRPKPTEVITELRALRDALQG